MDLKDCQFNIRDSLARYDTYSDELRYAETPKLPPNLVLFFRSVLGNNSQTKKKYELCNAIRPMGSVTRIGAENR